MSNTPMTAPELRERFRALALGADDGDPMSKCVGRYIVQALDPMFSEMARMCAVAPATPDDPVELQRLVEGLQTGDTVRKVEVQAEFEARLMALMGVLRVGVRDARARAAQGEDEDELRAELAAICAEATFSFCLPLECLSRRGPR